MQFWSSLKQRSNQIKFSFIQNLMPPCNMHHTITSHRHTRCDWWDQRAVILWMLELEERDAVASQRGGQEVAAREPRACRDRVHTRLCAALHRQAGVPRALQALAGGGHRCARQRGLPQAVGATCSAYRYDGPEVNTRLAHSEAKILHEKIQHKSYSDVAIIRIRTTRSKAQLLATFNYYNDSFGHPINKDLKADPKDEYLKMLRAIIRCFTCPDRYFEKVARQAILKCLVNIWWELFAKYFFITMWTIFQTNLK